MHIFGQGSYFAMSASAVGVEQTRLPVDVLPAAKVADAAKVTGATDAEVAAEAADATDAEFAYGKPRLSVRSQVSQASQLSFDSAFSSLVPSVLTFQANLCKSHSPVCFSTLPQGRTTCCQELRFMAWFSFPVGFAWQSRLFQIMCMFAICGQLGTVEQAAAASAFSWCSTFDTLLLANFSQMSALVSAAIGNSNGGLVGIWLQMFMIFNTCVAVLTLWMRFLAVPVFKNIGASPLVISAIQSYVLYNLPSAFFDMWFMGLREWYTVRAIVWPELVVEVMSDVMVIPVYSLFVLHLDMGLFGIGVSQTVLSGTKFFSYLLLTWASSCHKDCWPGICRGELLVRHRWAELMKGVVPAMMSSVVDGFQLKVLAFCGAAQGAEQAIVAQLVIQLYLIPLLLVAPMGEALSVRVGLYIAMFKIQEARFCCLLVLVCCFGLLVVLGVVIAVLMHPISHFFSHDPLVVKGLMEVQWALLLQSMSMLGLPCVLVLLKQGRILLICASMLMCYIAMLPMFFLVVSFGFTVLGALIYAQSAAFMGWAAFHVWNIWRSDWQACAMRSSRLAEVSMEMTEPDAATTMAGGCTSPLSETSETAAKSGSNTVEASRLEASSKDLHSLDLTDSLPVILSSDQNPTSINGGSTSLKIVANAVDARGKEASLKDFGVVILSETDSLPVLLSSGKTFTI